MEDLRELAAVVLHYPATIIFCVGSQQLTLKHKIKKVDGIWSFVSQQIVKKKKKIG